MPAPTGTSVTRSAGSMRGASVLDGREQQDTLVQNPIVPQVMHQPERYARAGRGEDRGGSRQADWPVLEHSRHKLVLSLP